MLETPRLILRPFDDNDVAAAHEWFGDPHVFRFYTDGPYRSVDETAGRLREYRLHFEKHGFGKWAVVEKASLIPIGDAGLSVAATGEVHVGYKFARSHWGQGFATEAAEAWVKHGFDRLSLNRITAFVHPQNTASIRVIQKLRFVLCRCSPEDGVDWNIYELFKPDS